MATHETVILRMAKTRAMIKFDARDVSHLVWHCQSAREYQYDRVEKRAIPSLALVHDREGVYLMSTGLPSLETERGDVFVVYAEGCDPGIDRDYQNTSQFLVGQAHFTEFIPIERFLRDVPAKTMPKSPRILDLRALMRDRGIPYPTSGTGSKGRVVKRDLERLIDEWQPPRLKCFSNTTDGELRKLILEKNASMWKLILDWCHLLTDDGMKMVAELCPHLRVLDLRGCLGITNQGIEAIAQGCPELRRLRIRGTKITHHGVKMVKAGCPKCRISV